MKQRLSLILCCLATASCRVDSQHPVQLELRTEAPANLLATCISQNYDGAFPRLYPVEAAGTAKAYEAYDGLRVEISDEGNSRLISLWSPESSSDKQASYLRKCVRMVEAP